EHVLDRPQAVRVPIPERRAEPARNDRGEESLHPHLLHGLDSLLPSLGCPYPSGGAGRHQRLHPLRGLHGEPQADLAADGDPAVVEPFHPGGIGDGEHVGAQVLDRVLGVAGGGGPVAGEVDGDHPPDLGEGLDLTCPQARVGPQRMDEQHRPAGVAARVGPMELSGASLGLHGPPTSLSNRPITAWTPAPSPVASSPGGTRVPIAAMSTCSDSKASAVASKTADAVPNTSGKANHSMCHEPSPRSSSAGVAPVIITAAPRHASAAANARMASIGFCFSAMLDDPPARIVTSGGSVLASRARSWATLAALRTGAATASTRLQMRLRSECHATRVAS